MSHNRRDSWIGLLSFGFFIMLFAMFFLIVPDYGDKVVRFFQDFKLQEVAPNFFLPGPEHYYRDVHPYVYNAAMQFCLIFGMFQFLVLGLRLYLKSTLSRIAETVSNIVFWLGAGYMTYLLTQNTIPTRFWFPFIGGVIAVIGLSIIARSLVTLLFWHRRVEA